MLPSTGQGITLGMLFVTVVLLLVMNLDIRVSQGGSTLTNILGRFAMKNNMSITEYELKDLKLNYSTLGKANIISIYYCADTLNEEMLPLPVPNHAHAYDFDDVGYPPEGMCEEIFKNHR